MSSVETTSFYAAKFAVMKSLSTVAHDVADADDFSRLLRALVRAEEELPPKLSEALSTVRERLASVATPVRASKRSRNDARDGDDDEDVTDATDVDHPLDPPPAPRRPTRVASIAHVDGSRVPKKLVMPDAFGDAEDGVVSSLD